MHDRPGCVNRISLSSLSTALARCTVRIEHRAASTIRSLVGRHDRPVRRSANPACARATNSTVAGRT
jgi:hypothetical protein